MPGPSTAELNGLNPQVQVDPLTFAIVSLPPMLVEEALVEELLLPPPPHPATTTVETAASKISDLKRFIAPPFPVRQTTFGKYLNKRNISSGPSWRQLAASLLRDLGEAPPERRPLRAACRATAT